VISLRTSFFTKYLVICAALFLASTGSGGSETDRNGIQVHMSDEKPLWLHVTLRSFSESRITLNSVYLPWTSRYSMVLVPVKPDGQCLAKYYPVDDPPLGHVSLEAHGSLSGDLDLRRVLPGLEEALKKSDIHLFWAYQAPEELQATRWSGGWILIPKTK
jgi:hypothetical protein